MTNQEKDIVPHRPKEQSPILGMLPQADVVDADWAIDVPPEGNPSLDNLGGPGNETILPKIKVKSQTPELKDKNT